MEYDELPEYDEWEVWINAHGEMEAKLFRAVSPDRLEIVLHLVEDSNAPKDRIADNTMYYSALLDSLLWVRERKGIEMPSGMDADYVEMREDGTLRETQHNHLHLDQDVNEDIMHPLKVVE